MARWESSFPEPTWWNGDDETRIHRYAPDERLESQPLFCTQCGADAHITNPVLGAFCSWRCHDATEAKYHARLTTQEDPRAG